MSLNWGGNVVQMPRRDAELSELAEMFPVPRITEDPDFADKSSGPRMLTNALVVAFCVALGIAVCVWRFR